LEGNVSALGVGSELMNNGLNGKNRSHTTGGLESLSAQQRRFWVLEQLEHSTASHHIPVCVRIRGALDVPRLEKATQLLHARHDVLSSRFVMEKDEPRTVRSLLRSRPVAVVDLMSLPEMERERSAHAPLAKDLNQAFDLQTGPLSRATLCRLGTEEHLDVLTFVLELESEGEEVGLFAIFDTWVLQHSQNRFFRFKRPKQPFDYINDPQMAWGERSQGGVTVHVVDFSHLEILREPHVGIFGKKLAEYIGEPSASFSMSLEESYACSLRGQRGA
jgi:condensation domain-containing protein